MFRVHTCLKAVCVLSRANEAPQHPAVVFCSLLAVPLRQGLC
jgi:hypothetical protein